MAAISNNAPPYRLAMSTGLVALIKHAARLPLFYLLAACSPGQTADVAHRSRSAGSLSRRWASLAGTARFRAALAAAPGQAAEPQLGTLPS